jgi:PAS domain S-box-containing protein
MFQRLKAINRKATWVLRGQWQFYGLCLLLSVAPLALSIGAIERRSWYVATMFLLIDIGLCLLAGSVYTRLETGNRFIEMSVDMFCIIGFDGFFKNLNPSWQKTLGFSTEELMAKPRIHFIHPDDRRSTESEIARLQQGEVTLAFENRYLCKDGSYRWLLWNAVSAPAQDVIYAVARDITRRKDAEAKIRDSEERYRKLFNLNPQPTWIHDRETLRFLAVNDAAVEKYGFSHSEFQTMTTRDLLPLEDCYDLVARKVESSNDPAECGVVRHRQRDGSVILAEVTSHKLLFDGYPAEIVIAVDVTERDRAEKERQRFIMSLEGAKHELELRNREVERATRLKSQFLAGMSHDLRTPLNAIVGFSDLLADEVPGPLNPKQKRFVGHIRQASSHLLQLIKDILDLSRIEAGQLELHCEDFDIDSVLPEVLSTIRPIAMAKNIQVEQSMDSDGLVHADRVRFRQILYNLLSNALKFTPQNGRVEVTSRSYGPSEICVSVADSGVGISEENQQLVFKEFRQVASSSAASQEGAGLGLAITKGLVEQQGGKIWLVSELGKGSRFSFSLPRGCREQPKTFAPAPLHGLRAERTFESEELRGHQ